MEREERKEGEGEIGGDRVTETEWREKMKREGEERREEKSGERREEGGGSDGRKGRQRRRQREEGECVSGILTQFCSSSNIFGSH